MYFVRQSPNWWYSTFGVGLMGWFLNKQVSKANKSWWSITWYRLSYFRQSCGGNSWLCGHYARLLMEKLRVEDPQPFFNFLSGFKGSVLPGTRQWWLSRIYPSWSWYSINRPWRDARLSWPGWCLWSMLVYPRNTVTYLRNSQAVSWPKLKPATRKSQVQPPNHYTTEPPIYLQPGILTACGWTKGHRDRPGRHQLPRQIRLT